MTHNIKKYFLLKNYVDYALRQIRAWFPNILVDRLLHALDLNEIISYSKSCEISELYISSTELHDWVSRYFPDYLQRFGDFKHAKLIEFYTTFLILNPNQEHVIMDAAGGINGYLGRLKCRKKILQDIRIDIETKEILGQEIDCIECDAGSIPLPDKTLDLISCHHSFEHFQNQADTAFVKEAQRLLKVGGKCCIVPLFFAQRYAEITDKISFNLKFDKFSLRIIDPTATIPGRAFSGNFARVYDLLSFQRRILQSIDLSCFKVSILELRLDGELLPDLSQQYHKTLTAVEFPHRALLIERVAS